MLAEVVPASMSFAGVLAALVIASGATALVAVGMSTAALHRSGRLTLGRVGVSAATVLLVAVLAVAGVLAVSPA